jgi:hypothetical protein
MPDQRTADRGAMQARGISCACFFETPRRRGRSRAHSGPSSTRLSPLAESRRYRLSTRIRGGPSVAVIATVRGRRRWRKQLLDAVHTSEGMLTLSRAKSDEPTCSEESGRYRRMAEAGTRWVELPFGWRRGCGMPLWARQSFVRF